MTARQILQAVAKVLAELSSQFLLPIAQRLKLTDEEAKHLRLFRPLQATDEVSVQYLIWESVNTRRGQAKRTNSSSA